MTDHACPVCGGNFATESILDEHCWDAHGACHHCGTEFEERASLYVHWLVAHEDSLSSKDRARVVSVTGEPTFRDRLAHQGPIDAVLETGMNRRTALLGSLAGLFSVAGASGLLLILPLDGLEFSVLAMVALLLSLYWLADGVRGGDIAGCPVDVRTEVSD